MIVDILTIIGLTTVIFGAYKGIEKLVGKGKMVKRGDDKTNADEENFEIIKIATKELFEPIEKFLYKIITIVDKTIKKGLHK